MEQITLVYVADPMCSWCWGFAPIVQQVRQQFSPKIATGLVLGGLRPGAFADEVDESMKGELRHHWESVHQRSGQPFDFSFFDRSSFLYDTEPASRAVVAVRRSWPGREWDYLHQVQAAFYSRNEDVTQAATLRRVAELSGLDGDAFEASYMDVGCVDETHEDYDLARQMGVSGFPALLLLKGNMVMRLTSGYAELPDTVKAIEEGLVGLEP